MAKTIQAVIWDLDGVIIDSADAHRRAVDGAVTSAGGHDGLDQGPASVRLSRQG